MASPPVPEAFTLTWGCQMVAYIINAVLYGMALLLVGQYFGSRQRSRDTTPTKFVVGTLGILATLQFTFLSHQIYVDYVILLANNGDADLIPFSATAQLLLIYLVAFTAQIFFASRLWMITNQNVFITAPIVLLALLQIGAGIAQTVLVAKVGRYSLLESTAKVTSTQSGSTAACDLLITLLLCYTLHGAKTGIRNTDSVIDQMVVYALERGSITSLCALLNLILFLSKPGTFIFMIFLEPSSQLYVISVLSMLANRRSLRNQLQGQSKASSSTTATGTFQLTSLTAVAQGAHQNHKHDIPVVDHLGTKVSLTPVHNPTEFLEERGWADNKV